MPHNDKEERNKRARERWRERYHSDSEFRAKMIKSAQKRYQKIRSDLIKLEKLRQCWRDRGKKPSRIAQRRRWQKIYYETRVIQTNIGDKKVHFIVDKRPKPDACEVCGALTTSLDYHHWDHNSPEIGLWLCKRCHIVANNVDRGIAQKYLEVKEKLEESLRTL